MGARTSRKAVVPRDDAADFEDDTVAGRATQFVGGIRRLGRSKPGPVIQFHGITGAGFVEAAKRQRKGKVVDVIAGVPVHDETGLGQTVQFLGGVRPRVIATIDGVDFVDVTRRGRNTQFIGGVRSRPPAPRRARRR